MNGLQDSSCSLISSIVVKLKEIKKRNLEIVVCPQFPQLLFIYDMLKGSKIHLGAQDCHFQSSGPHTGDVSPELLKNIGCKYVILGHSERRSNHYESNSFIRKKVEGATKAGLKVILCVGETLSERSTGKTLKVIENQLDNSIPALVSNKNLIIAYEPVWAIGTGKIASSAQIEEIHQFIKFKSGEFVENSGTNKLSVIYGGSINPENANQLLNLKDVDGGLIGGASLEAKSFCKIVEGIN